MRYRLLCFLSLLFCLFNFCASYAQNNSSYQFPLSNILLPSPNAASFQKYGDYPVNYSTGLPAITIPLYEIQSKEYQLPIFLSYHASGRKLENNFSTIGPNWTLNAGGLISRTIRGRPDILPNQKSPVIPADAYLSSSNFDLISSMAFDYPWPNSQTPESQYDIFTYQINGKSGKFIIKDGTPVFLSGEPCLIDSISETYFRLRDENGVQYFFGTNGDGYGATEEPVNPQYYNVGTISTSWYINKIRLLNGEEIKFKYGYATSLGTNTYIEGNRNSIETFTFQNDFIGASALGPTTVLGQKIDEVYQDFKMDYIKEIDFSNGMLLFEYNPDKTNLLSCKVVNSENTIVKNYTLDYRTFSNVSTKNNNSLLLTNLFIKDNNNSIIGNYSFQYNTNSNNLSQYGYGSDWWGYVNSAVSNVPYSEFLDNFSNSLIKVGNTTAKLTSFDLKMYGMLTQISYPTGGNTQFVYEPNSYLDNGVIKDGPGIRIKQIINTDQTGEANVKLFKYGSGENGVGTLLYKPDVNDFKNKYITCNRYIINDTYNTVTENKLIRTFSSRPNSEIAEAYNYPIYYPEVTEYYTDNSLSIFNGKIIYDYTTPNLQINRSIGGALGLNQCKTSFFYPFSEAKLMKKTIFSYTNGIYNKIADDSYSYETYSQQLYPELFMKRLITTNLDYAVQKEMVDSGNTRFYIFLPVNIVSGATRLIYKKHTDYSGSNIIETTKEYKYTSNKHPFPTEIVSNTSTGENIDVQMNYPQDMPLDGVMASMINKNVISPVIEKKKYLINGTNQQLLTTTHNDFTILPNDIVRPSDVKFSTGNNSLETRIQFNSYDIYGNVLEEQRSNDVKEVYLWGYNSIYPVARVTGSDYVTVNSVVNQSQIDAAVSNDASLRSVLNALRTDPRTNKALVTTYTYAPLIGMTSQTDPAGRTTYYEYDGLGRLKIVRDQNQNIVSKYCYNYAGQTTNCALQTFGNAPMSQSFTKNDCPGGATGSAVVYTVPANTYLSTISIADANARAQNDINANGQNYANANGSCSSSVSLNCNNYAGVLGFAIVFTSTTNGLQYSFPITPDGGVLGNVPADYYNVTISAPGNMTNYYFTVGSVSTYGVSATFYNVWIDNNNNTVTLDWLP